MSSRYTIISAVRLINGAEVTDQPGVYAALLPGGEALLRQWGHMNPSLISLGRLRRTHCVYIGSTMRLGLQTRLRHHVGRDSRQSTLRQSLGLLLSSELDLTPIARENRFGFHFGDGEPRLTKWMRQNILFAYRVHEAPRKEESSLIERHGPPLNIYNRRKHPFARKVLAMRERAWSSANERQSDDALKPRKDRGWG